MSTDLVWQPPVWYVAPERAQPFGIVCGSQLFVWQSRRPSGLMGEPWTHLDLTRPLPNSLAGAGSGGIPGADLGTLAAVLHELGLRAIWLVPAVGGRPSEVDLPILREWSRTSPTQLRAQHPEFALRELSARGPGGGNAILGGLTIRRAGQDGEAEGAYRCIYATWPQDPWAITEALADLPTEPAERARLVASALLFAEWALGVQLWWSPAHSGLTLLRSCLQYWARPENSVSIEPLPDEWQRQFRGPLRTFDMRWARPITPEELPPGNGLVPIWSYDRRLSYVSSAGAVPCGEPLATNEFHEHLPGVYRISAQVPVGWDARTPGPFHIGAGAGSYPLAVQDEWAWEPFVRLALRSGWDVRVREGWYWPKHQKHALLRTWHDRIYAAREAAEQLKASPSAEDCLVGRLSTKIVKRLGVATIGRLMPSLGRAVMNSEVAEASDLPIEWEVTDEDGRLTGLVEARTPLGRTDLVHPEWWSAIVSRASEALLSTAYHFAPTATVGLYIDCLYTLRPIPDLVADPHKPNYFGPRGVAYVPRDVLVAGDFVQLVKAAKQGMEG
jgi:hypothetical protein